MIESELGVSVGSTDGDRLELIMGEFDGASLGVGVGVMGASLGTSPGVCVVLPSVTEG
jgi:hypothetical protein